MTHDQNQTQTISRRTFMAAASAGVAAFGRPPQVAFAAATGRVPRDEMPHVGTWMAWPSSGEIWGSLLAGVQRDVALVATTISQFEPVAMCANPDAAVAAQQACGSRVRVTTRIPVDDCWMRDTCAVFRTGANDALSLNFNGWGRRQTFANDRFVAQKIASETRRTLIQAGFVGEGGAIETDGEGTVMATESSLVNRNRNKQNRLQIEKLILTAYGATKMIWMPGVRGQDITDDHIDATSRFIRPGLVMVQVPPAGRTDAYAEDALQQRAILQAATDARGRRLRVIEMAGPDRLRSSSRDFLDSYVNFAVVNGAVIGVQFGDKVKDAACRETLASAFPGRQIVQLDVDRLHAGGGGIHCITMHQPT